MENSVQLIYAGRSNFASVGSIGSSPSSINNINSRKMSNETESRARALADRMSEVARILANEPSLALYRIEEHVRKTVPRLTAQRAEVSRLDRDISGHVTDVDCVLSALRSIGRSRSSFQSMGELARNALFTKQQLDYERRRRSMAASVTDAIKRSSADVVHRLSTSDSPTAADAPDAAGAAGSASAANSGSGSVLESAKTFLRSKTIDYSQNLIRRAQATKSVEIPAGIDFSQAPPPPPPPTTTSFHASQGPPTPPPPLSSSLSSSQPPHMPPPASLMIKPQRSSSAQLLLKPVSECEEGAVQSPPLQLQEQQQQQQQLSTDATEVEKSVFKEKTESPAEISSEQQVSLNESKETD